MKLRKAKRFNTVESYASCICLYASCSCSCACSTCNSNPQLDNARYTGVAATKSDDVFNTIVYSYQNIYN